MISNKLFFGLATAIAATAFTACSSDETDLTQQVEQGTAINLTSQVVPTRAASELQTAALNTTVKVGAFGVNGTATVKNGNNNQYMVGSDATLTAVDKNMIWPDATSTVNIYAYAPYQSEWTYNTDNAFVVQTDQSADADYLASDLLYASASSVPTTDAIALAFSHKLSRINVTVKKGDDATSTLNGAAVYVINTCTATTLNPSTGALATTPSTVNSIKIGTLAAEPTSEGTTLYGITVPQTIAADTKLVKIVTAESTPKTYVAKLGTGATLEAGKSYNFTVRVGSGTQAELTLGSVTLTGWGESQDLGESEMEEQEVEPITLTATFQTPASNASYSAPTYTWTGSTSNLMTVFEFANGELANYHTLKFTFSNLVDGPVRIGYYIGSAFTSFGSYYNAGEKTIDLTALTIDLSTVTKIAFGGNSNAGSCDILASNVILIGNGDGSSTNENDNDDENGDDQGNDEPAADGKLYATFGTPGSNATYDGSTFTYSCTQSYSNLMNCFTFSAGELANYSKLVFTISELSNNVRINFCYGSGSSDNLNISSDNTGSGAIFGSNGTKTITMEYVTTALATVNKTLADVTSIRFGGASTSASCVVKASEMYLEPATTE